MDSLATLATHVREREAFEAATRGRWMHEAVISTFLLIVLWGAGYQVGSHNLTEYSPTKWTVLGVLLSALGTIALSIAMFLVAASTPWRRSPDSMDRIALRHEDSPLRDRIRITQWVLFDAAFLRFSYHEKRLLATFSQGVLGVAISGSISILLLPAMETAVSGEPFRTTTTAANSMLAVFLAFTILVILMTARAAKADLALIRHYGRQVLALDLDFGGFMSRAERQHVEKITTRGADAATASE